LLDFGKTGLAVVVRRIAKPLSSSIAGRVHATVRQLIVVNGEVGLPHGELAISLPMRRAPRS